MLKLQAIGFLGKDPQVNSYQDKTYVSFSVAVNEKGPNNTDVTSWIECSWWNYPPKMLDYLKKGCKVWIDGKPRVRMYDNLNGGKSASFSLNVSHLEIVLFAKGMDSDNASQTDVNNQSSPQVDDLPF